MLTNTDNFAILVKRDFGDDIEKPIDNYVLSTVKMVNSIANGKTIMQTLEDLKAFKRSTENSIKNSIGLAYTIIFIKFWVIIIQILNYNYH